MPIFHPLLDATNLRPDEDFAKINLIAKKTGTLYRQFLPFPDPLKGIVWKRPKEFCKKPYFLNGKPSRFDASQGKLGDCWLVSALQALTLNESVFNQVVPPGQSFDNNYTGAFHFRIWHLGKWYDVVVDDRLPVYKKSQMQCFVRSRNRDVFWAALLEKAYSKMCNRVYTDYLSIVSGEVYEALQDFTGGIVEVINPNKPPNGRPLKWFLNELFANRSLACCSFSTYEDAVVERRNNLISDHAYLISGIFFTADDDPDYHGLCIVRLTNPWGSTEFTGEWSETNIQMWKQIDRDMRERLGYKVENDGDFWMTENEIKQYFEIISICHLGPGDYYQSHYGYRIKTWSATTFRDDWIKHVSSGGSERDKLWINPQYKIQLKAPDSDPSFVRVIFELTRREIYKDKNGSKFPKERKGLRSDEASVGFYVYSLTNDQAQIVLLDEDFFKQNNPLNDIDVPWKKNRNFMCLLSLTEGWYCIVPYADKEGYEGSFLLRIFAEGNVNKQEFDTRISKSIPLKEPPGDTIIHEEHKRIFDDASQNEELDWIGLKYILEKGINSTAPSVFKSLMNSLANNHVAFSKDECRSMIAMLDKDNSGKLNYHEFCDLWKNIHFWCSVYGKFKDSEGYLRVDKLRDAFSSIGFNLNRQVFRSLVHLYVDEESQINLTDFILCGVSLETFFTRYAKGEMNNGFKLTLNEWVKITLAV